MAEFFSNADVRFGEIEVKDEGTSLGTDFKILDMVGTGVVATDAGGGEATITITGGGGGGTDTYTAPNEYFVDPTLSNDATIRQYTTIAAALAAGTTAAFNPIIIRLAAGETHTWNGTGLNTAPGDVIIYSAGAGELIPATLEFSSATVTSDNYLALVRLDLSIDTSLSIGIETLTIESCTGYLNGTVVDTPTSNYQTWNIRQSQLDLSMVTDGAETGGGSVYTESSRITYGDFNSYLWDHSGATTFWDFYLYATTLYASDASGAVTWDDTSGVGEMLVQMENVEFLIGGFGFGTLEIKNGGDGPTWIDCRIAVDDSIKPGHDFIFGSATEGTEKGLEIVYLSDLGGGNWPTDAPNGTTGRSHLQKSYGQMVFDSGAAQWRGDGKRVALQGASGAIPGIGVPVTLDTVWENDSRINLDPSIVGSMYRVTGTIMVGSGVANTALWAVDAVIEADATGPSISFLTGSIPTLLHEATPGQFSVTLSVVAGPPTGIEITITKNSGSANVPLYATLEIIEDNT